MRALIKFARSARRHKIGKAHALHVIRANPPVVVPAVPPKIDEQWLWIGTDDRGVEIEVIAVWMPDNQLIVIHAMATALRSTQGSTP